MIFIRIDKYIADSIPEIGRREVKKLIRNGYVRVGKTIIKDPKFKVDDSSEVYLNDERIVYKKFYYFVLYKPKGYITATKGNEPFALELINHPVADKLFPAGRLDKDVEGLVIFTNDGEFAHKIMSPKHHLEKEYEIEYNGFINKEKIEKVEKGLELENYTAKPAKMFLKNNKIHLIISEGRYHQVKEMMKALDIEILNLKRTRIGKITCEGLKEGEWREVGKDEIL
jgi:16S rRNA pseudouridine516 synthase